MSTTYYTKSHESFSLSGNIATVSITPYAVEQLGEITYVQLPEVGKTLAQAQSFGEVESVKTVSELYAPVGGVVREINTVLQDKPELLNEDLAGQGWMLKLELSAPDEVNACMSEADYQAYIAQLG